jgi:3',5'-cyclic AMP phosphodiesterase CpdA
MSYKVTVVLFLIFTSFPNAQQFRFAVWGDSQFQNPEAFEETVRRTELLKPDFVIHTGDMIHGYTYSLDNARRQWKRFKQQIEPLSVPFYPTPGNHDVTTKEIQPAYTEAWGEDKLFYSFDYENSHFIILNAYYNQIFDSVTSNQMEWLKEDLEKAKKKENIFVSIHSPLHLNPKYNWTPVHDLLKKYPVKAVFTGHYHYYDYRVTDGIKYFCLNTSGNMTIYSEAAGRSHHFLWITVDSEEIDIAVLTKDNIYKPDFVLPGELAAASKVLEKNETIVISDPVNGIDTTLHITIKNNSNRVRNYKIEPETDDYNWVFPWRGYTRTLEPGEEESLPVSVSYPGGKVSRTEMPKIKVSTEYYNQRGERSEYIYYYYLFNPPVTYAYKTTTEIILDGIDNEEAWRTVPGIEELYINENNVPAEENTSVKVLYDDENLYVFVKGEEPYPAGLTAAAYGDIPLVFGDDDFEIYFDTNRDLETFYRLMVNSKGTVLSSGPEGRFTFDFDVNTHIGKDFWSAEFRIPLKEIKITESPAGKYWGFNVRRHRMQAEIPQSDWSKMNTYPPYQPEYFGIIHFN